MKIALPQYPTVYRSFVEQQAKITLSQLSDSFPSTTSPTNGQNHTELHRLRESLEVLNENIRGQLLQITTLQHAMQEATANYETLKKAQKQLLVQINKLVTRSTRSRKPVLPIEVVEMICGLYGSTGYSQNHLRDGLQCPGSQLYKFAPIPNCDLLSSLKRAPDSEDTLKGDFSEVLVDGPYSEGGFSNSDDPKVLIKFLRSIDPSTLGSWQTFKLSIPCGIQGPELCTALLQHCGPSLATVKRFKITNIFPLNYVDLDGIDESFEDLKLPACTSLRVLGDFLYCFQNVAQKLVHLDVRLRTTELPISSFKYLDLCNVRWLEIVVGDKEREIQEYDSDVSQIFDFDKENKKPEELVHLPSLQRFSIKMHGETWVDVMLSILDCFHCGKLERIDIAADIVVNFSIDKTVPVNNLVRGIGSRFKSLRWLSLNLRNTTHFCEVVLPNWQVKTSDGEFILPNVKHLSFSLDIPNFEKAVFSLVRLLERRKEVNARIHTIELHVYDLQTSQRLLVEYLGLYVDHVTIVPNHDD